MQLTIQLAEVFLENPRAVLSIHQIAKKLTLPYGTAYNRIHQMAELGLIKIVPQGKAKLCALNAANPMTSVVLGLGASQKAQSFLTEGSKAALLTEKIREFVEYQNGDQLQMSLLLNIELFRQSLAAADFESEPVEQALQNNDDPENNSGEKTEQLSIDLFLVMPTEEFNLDQLESFIHPLFPSRIQPRITFMAVKSSTLFGMLREQENEAGLSAYHMLRRGLILTGFERFYSIVLKSFAPRIF